MYVENVPVFLNLIFLPSCSAMGVSKGPFGKLSCRRKGLLFELLAGKSGLFSSINDIVRLLDNVRMLSGSLPARFRLLFDVESVICNDEKKENKQSKTKG